MVKPYLSFLLLLFSWNFAMGQQLTLPAAKDFLPAFQRDDTVLLKTTLARQPTPPSSLLLLASATNCPHLLDYLLGNYPGLDSRTAVSVALMGANRQVLDIALKHGVSLGGRPVNQLLRLTRDQDNEAVTADVILGLLFYAFLPESAISGYQSLVVPVPDDTERAEVAAWLIGRQQGFDYRELDLVKDQGPVYQPVFQLLVRRLADILAGAALPGFPSRSAGHLFSAVMSDDVAALRRLLDSGAVAEVMIGERSLLSFAVSDAGLPVVKLLLNRGADANWHEEQSGQSVFSAALKRGDRAIFRELLPYINNFNRVDGRGNAPVFYCIKNFFLLPAGPGQNVQRLFLLNALKDLGRSGADFNQPGENQARPVSLLPKTPEDSLSVSLVLSVLDRLTDQFQLGSYAEKFHYDSAADRPILTLLCRKLENIEPLFYDDGLEKAKLFPVILQEARRLPDPRIFSPLLRAACYAHDVQKVRWLLNEVPSGYLQRSPGLHTDSLRALLVNTPVAGCNENILYFFLNTPHTPDWSSKAILKTLIAAGGDLYQEQSCDSKKPIDLLMASDTYQKAYGNEAMTGLLKGMAFSFDGPGDWVKEPATSDRYRIAILAFQRDQSWLENLKNCFTLDVSGAGVSRGAFRRVNVDRIGLVDLGKFPQQSCGPLKLSKVLIPAEGKEAYDFSAANAYRPYGAFPFVYQRKDFTSFVAEFDMNGSTGIIGLSFNLDCKIDIPPVTLTEKEHDVPPLVIIRNHEDAVQVWQNGIPTSVPGSGQKTFDRSRGALQITYQAATDKARLRLEVFGRLNDTGYPDLLVPVKNDALSRLHLYAEIMRLRRQTRHTAALSEEEQIYRKQDSVVIHLLSEYALQRGFPQKSQEEYRATTEQLAGINRLLGPLGQFYEQHAVLDFNNLQQLQQTLQTLVAAPGLSPDQRALYGNLLKKLVAAGELSDLAETYGQLMNTELLQQAEQQLDNNRRLALEMALYAAGGHLKLEDKP